MKIRELKTKDTFPLSRIFRKIGAKELLSAFERAANSADGQGGLEVVALLVEQFGLVEDELLAFLGDLTGMTAKEFGELPLSDLKDVLAQLVRTPEVAGFFGFTSKTTT